jgi:hypothetical protein
MLKVAVICEIKKNAFSIRENGLQTYLFRTFKPFLKEDMYTLVILS